VPLLEALHANYDRDAALRVAYVLQLPFESAIIK
jgi:hypothetical protein